MPFLEELKSLIVGTSPRPSSSQVLLSAAATIPSGDGPTVSVIQTGGYQPRYTHNITNVPAYEHPTAQIVVRAKDLFLARQMLRVIYFDLCAVRNQLVGAQTVNVTSITRSGSTATVTVAAGHPFVMGQTVTIAGAGQSEYNGSFTINYLTKTTFSYTVLGAPVTPATGTITASYPGTWYVRIEPLHEMADMGIDSNGRSRVVFNLRALKGSS